MTEWTAGATPYSLPIPAKRLYTEFVNPSGAVNCELLAQSEHVRYRDVRGVF
jgi:hypothetical protein